MRYALHIQPGRKCANAKQLFFSRNIEAGKLPLSVTKIGVGHRRLEQIKPSRPLDACSRAFMKESFSPISNKRGELRRVQVVEISQRRLSNQGIDRLFEQSGPVEPRREGDERLIEKRLAYFKLEPH